MKMGKIGQILQNVVELNFTSQLFAQALIFLI
jgi:hypothetical protein